MKKIDLNDIVGKKFGHWEVLKYSHYAKYKHFYFCKCRCGNIEIVRRDALILYKTKSCGCKELDDLIGQKFGRLTVISFSGSKKKPDNRHYYHYYFCKCDCGNTKIVERANLLNNHTLSCGCLHSEKFNTIKHGLSNHRLHRIWDKMKYRCLNSNSPRYQDYGGRGITVCQEWQDSFMNFYDWAINNGYADNLSIDRIDVNGNYEPSNCRWANHKTQGRNTRYNHLITFCGQTLCLSEWAERYDILPDTLQMRLTRGWSVRKALITPVKKN